MVTTRHTDIRPARLPPTRISIRGQRLSIPILRWLKSVSSAGDDSERLLEQQFINSIEITPLWMHRHRFMPGEMTCARNQAVYALWLVLDGAVVASTPERTIAAEAGNVCLTYLSPYRQADSPRGAEWLSLGLHLSQFGYTDFLTGYPLPAVWRPGKHRFDRLLWLLTGLIGIIESGNAADQMIADGFCRSILGEFLFGLDHEFGAAPPVHGRLDVVVRLMNADPAISIAKLAAEIGYSPAQFRREFRRWTGMSPQEFVARRRIDRAKRLLDTTDSVIYSIAEQVGFRSVSHLIRCFRDVYGVSPAKYRQLRSSGEHKR